MKKKNLTIVLLSIFSGILFFSCLENKEDIAKTDHSFDRADVSFRIGVGQSFSKERCDDLLQLLYSYKGVTDEITFFTAETHAPLPTDKFKETMDILRERMNMASGYGYRTGLNILATIGHHNENLRNSLQGDYMKATDIYGNISEGTYCPNDPDLHIYIREIYKMMAETSPDYIWIDDDIRLAGHMPVYLTCFCDQCLSVFEEETGVKYTRESLRKAADEGTIEDKLAIRNAWIQHNRNTHEKLFRLIERTVHAVHPDLPLGFMSGNRIYEGYDFDIWADILAGPDQVPVLWRPGGGFYNDNITSELSRKAHDIGQQVSLLPENVRSIQSEIENFPWERLKKAENIVVLEACEYIAAGCTGVAYNVLSQYDEPLTEYKSLIEKLQEARPFMDLLVKTFGRSPNIGIATFWNKNSFSTGNISSGSWFGAGNPVVRHELYDLGLPAAYLPEHAEVIFLSNETAYAMSDEDIRKILSGGVYMDALSLDILNKRGYGHLTGFALNGSKAEDCIEEFVSHPLNTSFAGCERNIRQSFYNIPAYFLQKTKDSSQTLSRLIDYEDKEVSDCTMGIFENELGGRVCVSGYYPWSFSGNLSRSLQLKSIIRWLSKDKMSAFIDSYHKINLWIRSSSKEGISLAFVNSSFDPAKDIVLKIQTEKKEIIMYDMKLNQNKIVASGTDGNYNIFRIPYVDPWEMRLVVFK